MIADPVSFILGAAAAVGALLVLVLFLTLYIDWKLRPPKPPSAKAQARAQREAVELERLTRPMPRRAAQ